jgi:hypothetical protein
MKTKILMCIVLLLSVTNIYSQFKINADGSALFKVNNVLAGFTGNAAQGNVSFGYASFPNVSVGQYNTAFGSSALYSNTTSGDYNTAIGSSALYFNTSGTNNTATGVCALYVNTGSYNTANGSNTLIGNTTGDYNTAMGRSALQENMGGSLNTAIGYHSGANNPSNLTNVTTLGHATYVTASNQVRIGNYNVISIGGFVNWSTISDRRAKQNIKADVPGLAFINRLQPVTYNLNLDAMDNLLGIDKAKKDSYEKGMSQELKDKNEKARKAKEDQVQTGFVAQEVEKIAQSIGYNFSGVEVDEAGIYELRYAEFVVPLVKAVQELSKQNDLLQAQINDLQKKDVLRSGSATESGTGLSELTNSAATLQQNFPNPFSQTTQIKYYLPQNIKTASLNIYNLQGKQLKQIAITQHGESSLLIAGSEFDPGIYLYVLIADGREVDVKRMILTE